jgi:hypothetical protein
MSKWDSVAPIRSTPLGYFKVCHWPGIRKQVVQIAQLNCDPALSFLFYGICMCWRRWVFGLDRL